MTEAEQQDPVPAALIAPHADFADAFDDLYESAYQHAFKLLGNRQEAEDVAQEACTRACLRWRRLENPAAWVTHVATNLVFDRFRRKRVAERHAALVRGAAYAVADPHFDLYHALAQLPKRQREVVALRYLADFSEAQTAAALGCAPGTVKAHAARGLRALRESLVLTDEGDAQ
jgi:RNA polymerase sigma-70 factor (ECF subfamily)